MTLLDAVKNFMLTESRMKEMKDYVVPVKKTIVMPRSKVAPPPVSQPMPKVEVEVKPEILAEPLQEE
jgi:hypothetical protein